MTSPLPFTAFGPVEYDLSRPLVSMPVSLDPVQELLRLNGILWAGLSRLQWYDMYYEREQPLQFMIPALAAKLGNRIPQLAINWFRLVCDSYENRLDVEGFRYPGQESSDAAIQELWQANNLDEQSQQAHLESLTLGRSYVIVGAGDTPDDAPVITVESPFQVTAVRDPKRTRIVKQALKSWQEIDGSRWSNLYLPDSTTTYTVDNGQWREVSRDRHELGMVPVIPMVNRPRPLRPDGLSEAHDLMPLMDAANKMATDMMISGEYHAMPRRMVFGIKQSDFEDQAGNPVPTWKRDAMTLWATENADARAMQFNESDLAVFHNTIRLLARLGAQLAGLPPDELAFDTVNPPSAESRRAGETTFVKRVERKQTYLGGAWEDVIRTALRFQTGAEDKAAKSLETMWRDAGTPTRAQMADATVKLVTGRDGQGRSIIPVEQAREDLGYGPIARARMAEMDKAAASAQLTAIRDSLSPATPTTIPSQPNASGGNTNAGE